MNRREFKFRAKNVHDGKLYYSEDIGLPNFWQQVKDGHMVKVEQYINQKLHEKEIYEGDIIHRPEIKIKDSGTWNEIKFVVEFVLYTDGDDWTRMAYNYCIPEREELEHTKIIGNVTENPELIDARICPRCYGAITPDYADGYCKNCEQNLGGD